MTNDIEEAWNELAWWASQRPRPKPPELIPGLPGVNRQRMLAYREQLVGWKAGKAEALLHGLKPRR
jgi:hypothetical protein